MKFLADENIDKPIVERLRDDGHIVLYVLEMEPSISDDEVIRQANQESALLLTADKDQKTTFLVKAFVPYRLATCELLLLAEFATLTWIPSRIINI